MDQAKIGRFIAERRKKAGLTQVQLADKLALTDRAVSKWERGKAMPDASIMLTLCEILQITVNDLLSGEVIAVENYDKELEQNLLDAISQKEQGDKRLLSLEWVIAILSLIILFFPILIAAILPMEEWLRILLIFSGVIPAIIGFLFALRIEQTAGYYECGKCGHRYVPTFWAVNLAPHVGRSRRMRCPVCHKKSWQKKTLRKD